MRRFLPRKFWILTSLLAALVLTPSALIPSAEGAEEKKDLEAEAQARQEELEALQKTLESERERLRRVRRKEESVLDLFEESELVIEKLDKEKEQLEKQIASLEQSTKETRKELEKERKNLKRKRTQLQKRLTGLYKLGPVGSMRVLLSSSSVSQFQRDRYYLELILKNDAELVASFQTTVGELERLEDSLQREARELDARREELKKNRADILVERNNRYRIVQAVKKERTSYEQVVTELAQQSEELQRLLEVLAKRIKSLDLIENPPAAEGGATFASFQGSLIPPVKGSLLTKFGRHVNEAFGTVTFNNGIEIAARAGTPIEAVFSGVVIFADRFKGYGNLLIVNHGDGFYSLYAHCRDLKKTVGDPVEAREVIAWVGESGSMEGPNLYFEIRQHGRALDPAEWLLLE